MKELKSQVLGFGVFLAKSPSLGDPAGLYRWTLSVSLGTWFWGKNWYSGIGTAQ